MEFSYRISEAEYRKVLLLQQMGSTRSTHVKTIVFWLFILLCLTLLWFTVSRGPSTPSAHSAPSSAIPTATGWLADAITAILGALASWYFLLRKYRKKYKGDPESQGVFSVSLTPQSISIRNSAGTSFEGAWSVFESWREKLGLILLQKCDGTSVAFNLATLTEPQRAELRGILSAALPQK